MQKFYEFMYRRAEVPSELPWHREVIPPPLVAAVERQGGGRALDLGCGTGVYATYLAERGFAVTAIDFVPDALNMARERANQKGVAINFVGADILEWSSDGVFELIFDSGCLHGIANASKRELYKQRLLNWLAPAGNFALMHFSRRHLLDWRPMGPRRRTRTEINRLFAPELVERSYWEEVTHPPLPVGPTVQLGHYLFELAPSQ